MRPNATDRGFNLVELMVTVTVIGILAVIALPSVLEALQRREVSDAGQAVQDLVEYARVQAASRNRAYEIRISATPGEDLLGDLQAWEGATSACMGFAALQPDPSLVRKLFLYREFPLVRLVATVPENLTDDPLCIKPDGRVFQVVSDTTPMIIQSTATGDLAGGDARIELQRVGKSGRYEGPIHAVVVPFNGLARVVVQ